MAGQTPRSEHLWDPSSSSHPPSSQPPYAATFVPYDVGPPPPNPSLRLPPSPSVFHFPRQPQGPPSSTSSPSVSHGPSASPGSYSGSVPLPPTHDTISPTSLYQHQQHASAPPPPPGRSPGSSLLPPYRLDGAGPRAYPPPEHRHAPTAAPALHRATPMPSSDLALPLRAGSLGDPEGWSSGAPDLAPSTSESPSTSSIVSRPRTTSVVSKRQSGASALGAAPRKRTLASCSSCRKRKLKCDRCLPCSSCVAKGTECIWEGDAVPLYTHKDQNETKDLRAQVDRLQALLDDLIGSPPSGRPKLHIETRASERAVDGPPSDLLPSFDLLGLDLAEALVEIAFTGTLPPQQVGNVAFDPQGRSGAMFLDEARQACLARSRDPSNLSVSMITPSSSSSEPSPASTSFPNLQALSAFGATSVPLHQRRFSAASLVDTVPSIDELEAAVSYFASAVHPLLPIYHLPAFQHRLAVLRTSLEHHLEVEPLSIAVIVSTAAAGLDALTDQQAVKVRLSGDRRALVAEWTRVAVSALIASRFLEQPDLDGVRVCLLLASMQLAKRGPEGYPNAISLLSTATQAAFALELHRDPVRNGTSRFSFLECQERRRVFWCLFVLCTSLATDTSRPWPQFDLRQIDCQFPLDCSDEDLALDELAARASARAREHNGNAEETPVTLLLSRAKLACAAKKNTDTAFAAAGCRYPDVVALDFELRKLEQAAPDCYRIDFDNDGRTRFAGPPLATESRAILFHLSLSSEIIRLNRPFLVLGASDETYQHSREQCVKHAKRVLFLATSPTLSTLPTDLNLKALLAATVLAIEVLQSPEEPDVEYLNSLLAAAEHQLERASHVSLLYSRAHGVIQFLRRRIAASTKGPITRRAKRARTARYSPDDVKPSPSQTRWQGGRSRLGEASVLPSRTGSPDSDSELVERRRKTNRPAFVSARSEGHVATRARFASPPVLRSQRSHSADDAAPPAPLSAPANVDASPSLPFSSTMSSTTFGRSRTQSDTIAFRPQAFPSAGFSPENSMLHGFDGHDRYPQSLDVGLGIGDPRLRPAPLSSTSMYEDSEASPFFSLHPQSDPHLDYEHSIPDVFHSNS